MILHHETWNCICKVCLRTCWNKQHNACREGFNSVVQMSSPLWRPSLAIPAWANLRCWFFQVIVSLIAWSLLWLDLPLVKPLDPWFIILRRDSLPLLDSPYIHSIHCHFTLLQPRICALLGWSSPSRSDRACWSSGCWVSSIWTGLQVSANIGGSGGKTGWKPTCHSVYSGWGHSSVTKRGNQFGVPRAIWCSSFECYVSQIQLAVGIGC